VTIPISHPLQPPAHQAAKRDRRVPIASILEHLFADVDANVYAVIDGANCPDLLDRLYDLRPEFTCLHSGDLAPDMAEVAPYLVRLILASPFTHWLVQDGWHRSWCIYLVSPTNLRTMRRHLRTLLMVYDPDGKPVYFRFYDPRVMRVYLPTCTAEEVAKVFGPIKVLLAEGEEPLVVVRFQQSANGADSALLILANPEL
jgi:hypothetical protein